MRPEPGAGTIAGALARAAARLPPDSPRLDAEVLLAHCLGRPRSHLAAWPEKVMDAEVLACFEGLVARREAGEPVAHLTGVREFWSLALVVTPATLIPRPETETLVERALSRIPTAAPVRVADLGTGSGAVALALAAERPRARILATDISPPALAVAARNRATLGFGNLALAAMDWCHGLDTAAFHVVVSNPPYVAAADPHLARGDVRFEPAAALAAGADGLDALQCIAAEAPRCLVPGGWLVVEHGAHQGAAVRRLLTTAGLAAVATHRDHGGRDRVTEGRRPVPGPA